MTSLRRKTSFPAPQILVTVLAVGLFVWLGIASTPEQPATSDAMRALAGEGTAERPYEVGTAEDLVLLRQLVADGSVGEDSHFLQTADIDLAAASSGEGAGWSPIGDVESGYFFRGTYDGGGHVVTNLDVHGLSCPGLFGYLDGTVRNLGIASGSVEGGFAGGIASQGSYRSSILNCFNSARVHGASRAGGICEHSAGEVVGCWNTGEVTADTGAAGGIVATDDGSQRYSHSVGGAATPEAFGSFDGTGEVAWADVAATLVQDYDAMTKSADHVAPEGLSTYLASDGEALAFRSLVDSPQVMALLLVRFATENAHVLVLAVVGIALAVLAAARTRRSDEDQRKAVGAQEATRRQRERAGDRRQARQARAAASASAGALDASGDASGAQDAQAGEASLPRRLVLGRVVGTALTLVAVVAGTVLANGVLELKREDGVVGMRSYHDQPQGLTDVLVLGSSRAGFNLDLETLWTEQGISAYALWGGAQPFWNSYYFLKEALETSAPQVVILEMRAAAFDFAYGDDGRQYANADGLAPGLDKLRAIRATAPQERWADLALGLPIYHARFDELTSLDFTGGHRGPTYKGSYVRYGTGTVGELPDPREVTTIAQMPAKEETYLRAIISTCISRDIPIVLVAADSEMPLTLQPYFNYVQRIADQYSVPFLNFALLHEETGIVPQDFYTDNVHLNTAGGRKFAAYVGRYLKEGYGLADHRGDAAYESWVGFAHDMQNEYLSLITDPRDYLAELARDGRSVALYNHGMTPEAMAAFQGRAQAAGFDVSAFAGSASGQWAVIEDSAGGGEFFLHDDDAAGLMLGTRNVSRRSGVLTAESDGKLRSMGLDRPGVYCAVFDPYTGKIEDLCLLAPAHVPVSADELGAMGPVEHAGAEG